MPKFRSDAYAFFIVLPNLNYGQDLAEFIEEDSEKTSEKTSEKILDIIKDNNTITAELIVEKLGISSRAVEYQLKRLQDNNAIKRVGGRKFGYWAFSGN